MNNFTFYFYVLVVLCVYEEVYAVHPYVGKKCLSTFFCSINNVSLISNTFLFATFLIS